MKRNRSKEVKKSQEQIRDADMRKCAGKRMGSVEEIFSHSYDLYLEFGLLHTHQKSLFPLSSYFRPLTNKGEEVII